MQTNDATTAFQNLEGPINSAKDATAALPILLDALDAYLVRKCSGDDEAEELYAAISHNVYNVRAELKELRAQWYAAHEALSHDKAA